MKKTWWQQQQKQHTQEHAHHHDPAQHVAPVEKFTSVPPWLKELLAIIEAALGAISTQPGQTIEAAQREVVAQKLAEFKAKLPE